MDKFNKISPSEKSFKRDTKKRLFRKIMVNPRIKYLQV